MTFAELSQRVRDHLGQDHRYAHCVRVARLAERFARAHGVSTRKARIAGMLHDLTRLYDADTLVAECGRRAIPIDGYARKHPIVLHAPLSAAVAQERFGIDDGEVLSAIAKHTLGDVDMSALDQVVYLADGLEPGRSFAERASLEQLAMRDLSAATLATISSSQRYLRARGLEAAPQTLRAKEALEGIAGRSS